MEEPNQPLENNPPVETEGSSEEVGGTKGEEISSEDFAKTKLEETLGRKFKDLDDALKTVKGTYAEQSKIATGKQQVAQKPQVDTSNFVTKEELWGLAFTNKYPQANEYLDKVKTISKGTGEDFVTAFEASGLKEVFEIKQTQKAQKDEELKNIPQGSAKLAPLTDEIKKSQERFYQGKEKPEESSYVKSRISHLIPQE